jgi:hypothetical protein
MAIRSGLKCTRNASKVGQIAGIENGIDRIGEFGFAGAVMGERQQADHGAAGVLIAVRGDERCEGVGVGAAREQLIAIDQVDERHRLPAQGVDDVSVVNDVAVPVASLWWAGTLQSEDVRCAEEAVEVIVGTDAGFPLPAYLNWNAGVTFTRKSLNFDLRYYNTNLSKENCYVLTGDPNSTPGGSIDPVRNPEGLTSRWCSATFVAKLWFALN